MDIQKAKRINSNYFKTYSNGGYGRIPNAVGDDQVTTDQFVARRIQFPSTKVKEYYTDYKNSSFYQNNQNRALTTAQSIPALQSKGVPLVGIQNYGKYSMYTQIPDPSNTLSLYSTESETNTILWLVIGIGALALIANTVAPL